VLCGAQAFPGYSATHEIAARVVASGGYCRAKGAQPWAKLIGMSVILHVPEDLASWLKAAASRRGISLGESRSRPRLFLPGGITASLISRCSEDTERRIARSFRMAGPGPDLGLLIDGLTDRLGG
jgi:hypothetical protein